MLAALLYGPSDLRIEETDKPQITSDEILVKVKSAAICGTDLRMYRHGVTGIDRDNPRIIGHEFSGVIAEVGSDLQHYAEGMRVTVAPNMGCGVCDQCVRGNTHHCADYKALGINLDGGFAEYVRIPSEAILQGNVIQLDEGLSFAEAALNEPLSCVYNGFVQCSVKPGDNVLVIGGGPIGLMHAKLALMAGAAQVMMNDLSKERLSLCTQVEPRLIPVQSDNLEQTVQTRTKGVGLDVCVVACPSPQAQAKSLELMGQNGRINFFGGLPKEKEVVGLNTNLIHYKQLVITGSTRASVGQFRKSLSLISNGLIDVKSLISNTFTIREFTSALEAASSGQGLKNIINF